MAGPITQDELWTLTHLRNVVTGCAKARAASEASFMAWPGRAQGRVAAWSLGRTVKALGRFGRRPFEAGDGVRFTADERRLLQVLRAIARNDRARAESIAAFLVRREGVAPLVDSLTQFAEACPVMHIGDAVAA